MLKQKIFKGLLGQWDIYRSINNSKVANACGVVVGTAEFTPLGANDLLYQESGIFTTADGASVKVFKDYVYRYNPATDQIEKHFALEQKPSGIFYLLQLAQDLATKAVTATAAHLCVDDTYLAAYDFGAEEQLDKLEQLEQFKLSITATGPNKVYETETMYTRVKIQQLS